MYILLVVGWYGVFINCAGLSILKIDYLPNYYVFLISNILLIDVL